MKSFTVVAFVMNVVAAAMNFAVGNIGWGVLSTSMAVLTGYCLSL